jgi:hypothetical protein
LRNYIFNGEVQMRINKNVKRVLCGVFVALIVFLSVMIVALYIQYPHEYVHRCLIYRNSDAKDYMIFPERIIENEPPSFYFTEELNETMVSSGFEGIEYESSGFFTTSTQTIEDLENFLESTETTSFIVIRNDIILYEKYFNGYERDSIQTSFSVAKSFVSALIGIAIDEGVITSVEDSITLYIPELKERDDRFEKITIEHLLTMSSGIQYREFGLPWGDDAKTYYFPNLRKLAVEETQIVGEPGTQFLYNNYHPLLLGLILERATGMTVSQYLEKTIWKPLGMEHSASWSLDSEDGFEKMESGINARAIDFAKFGRLFLHEGNWNGTQIISEEWVHRSTRAERSCIQGGGSYRYMWWGNTDAFFAFGKYGQYIFICTEKNLLIVRNGRSDGNVPWEDIFYQFTMQM